MRGLSPVWVAGVVALLGILWPVFPLDFFLFFCFFFLGGCRVAFVDVGFGDGGYDFGVGFLIFRTSWSSFDKRIRFGLMSFLVSLNGLFCIVWMVSLVDDDGTEYPGRQVAMSRYVPRYICIESEIVYSSEKKLIERVI